MTTRKIIHESSYIKISCVASSVYDFALDTDKPVVLSAKVLNIDAASETIINRFYNEYKTIRKISHPNIRKVYGQAKHQNHPTLLLEWINGRDLKFFGKVPDLQIFFNIAMQATLALEELHRQGILHTRIDTQHIIYDLNKKETKLIGLSWSLRLNERSNRSYLYEPHIQSIDSKNHQAPEQAGTLQREIDERSDTYCLGIVFYFLLTGNYPYACINQDELKIAHLNDNITPICEIDPKIPISISNMVSKMLRTHPENRYQSARGLLHDLKRIKAQIASDQSIKNGIELGEKDIIGRLHSPKKYFGRDTEIKTILETFGQVKTCTSSNVTFIRGTAGVGKSTLVNEIKDIVLQDGGYFVSGKYNQLHMEKSHAAILDAMGMWCNLLLKESESEIERMQEKICRAVGMEWPIITHVLPQARRLIWNRISHDVPSFDSVENTSRFYAVLCRFLNALSRSEKPVVFVQDDLQWADEYALELLKHILTDSKIKHTLFIGIYRDDSGSDSKPLTEMIDHVTCCPHVMPHTIGLQPLPLQHAHELVLYLLGISEIYQDDVCSLVDVVYHKTNNNPFHIVEFMKLSIHLKELYFCHDELIWKWDIKQLEKQLVTSNVANLMAQRIRDLPLTAQTVMKRASILGKDFNSLTLALLVDEIIVKKELCYLVTQGMVIQLDDDRYCFSHDLVQQASYKLAAADGNVRNLHLELGRALAGNEKNVNADRIFMVTNHTNEGLCLIEDKLEKIRIAELNMITATRARLESSFHAASKYIEVAISLLPENKWSECYNLSLKTHVMAAKMLHINADVERSSFHIDQVLKNAKCCVDKVEVSLIKLNTLDGQSKNKETMEYGLNLLRELGESFSERFASMYAFCYFSRAKFFWWQRGGLKKLLALNETEDLLVQAKVKVLAVVFRCVIKRKPQLAFAMIFRALEISLRHGPSRFVACHVTYYVIFIVKMFGYSEEVFEIGQLALDLNEKFPEHELTGITHMVLSLVVYPVKHPLSYCIKKMKMASNICFCSGDVDSGVIVDTMVGIHELMSGIPLCVVKESLNDNWEKARNHDKRMYMQTNRLALQVTLNHMKPDLKNGPSIYGDLLQKNQADDILKKKKSDVSDIFYFYHYLFATTMAYCFKNYKLATEMDSKCMELVELELPIAPKIYATWVSGMVALSKSIKTCEDEFRGGIESESNVITNYISTGRKRIKEIKILSQYGPHLYENKIHLLLAELACLQNCYSDSIFHYDKAIDLAEKNENLFEEALACERAFLFYIKIDDLKTAQRYHARAMSVYHQWGGISHVSRMQQSGYYFVALETTSAAS